MSGDIVERLRRAADTSADGDGEWYQLVHRCREAADEIERLRAERDDLHVLLRGRTAELQAEVERLRQLHERIAASDDVAEAYQQVYFEDFPTVKQAVAETLLAKEQLAAERAEVERLRAERDSNLESDAPNPSFDNDNDIVQRLRYQAPLGHWSDGEEAAEVIERLRAEVGAADALANMLRALVAEQHDEIKRLRALLADLLNDCDNWGCSPNDRYAAALAGPS